jgi:hypothetical protein
VREDDALAEIEMAFVDRRIFIDWSASKDVGGDAVGRHLKVLCKHVTLSIARVHIFEVFGSEVFEFASLVVGAEVREAERFSRLRRSETA